MLKKLFLAACLLAGTSLYAQVESSLLPTSIARDTLLLDLMKLTGPEMAGRATGHEGYDRAAEYVAKKLTEMVLDPVPLISGQHDLYPHYQMVPYKSEQLIGASVVFGKKKLLLGKDLFTGTGLSNGSLSSDELLFVGYGEAQDLKAADIKGKVVLAVPGERTADGSIDMGNWRQQYANLAKHNPRAIILIDPDFKKEKDAMVARLTRERISLSLTLEERERGDAGSKVPLFVLSPKAGKKLMKAYGIKAKKLLAAASKNKRGVVKAFEGPLQLVVEVRHRRMEVPNVAGMVRGEQLPEEYVILSAHLDHLGVHDGKLHPGADDNGSGSAALLSIARQYSEWQMQGIRPQRSIIFLWLSGEEIGLLGSKWFTSNDNFPLESIMSNLNIDMIGRHDNKHKAEDNYLYLIGADRISKDLHDLAELINQQCCEIDLDLTYNDPKDPNRYYYRSDHYNFAKHGIPSVFFFSGVHDDYHQPGDTLDKIDFDRLKRNTEYILHLSWELASRSARLRITN
ncbi:MAG: M28 family peptidase [Bacteroidia bacterium]